MKKTALGVLGSLALAEFRVRTLFLVRFKRRMVQTHQYEAMCQRSMCHIL